MEEEKKKKKNKKKRGKQTKTSVDVSAVNEETTSTEQSNVVDPMQNHHTHVLSNGVVQNVGTSELDAKTSRHQVFEEKGVNSTVSCY